MKIWRENNPDYYTLRKDYFKQYRNKNRQILIQKSSDWQLKNRQRANEISHKYYQNNKQTSQEYYQKNKENILQRNNLYNKNNKNKIKIRQHERYLKKKDEIIKYGKNWRINNREKRNQNAKDWRKNNPSSVLKSRIKYLTKLAYPLKINLDQVRTLQYFWSKTVKKLDNNMCKLCDSKDNLNAHHIQPKSDYPQMALIIKNGITLCKKCHKEVHGWK